MRFRVPLLCSSTLLLGITSPAAHLVYEKNITAAMVAVDAASNTYIANGSAIAKFDPDGNTLYSKQIALMGTPNGMTVDSVGNMIVVGNTNSDLFPATAGVFQPKRSRGVCYTPQMTPLPYPCPDAFIAKFDSSGNLAWASYLGGLGIDVAYGVATDSSNNIYVVGLTQSSDFPRVRPFQAAFGGYADAFITKVSSDGSTILYSSTLGGQGYDLAYAIAVDSAGSAYFGGQFSDVVPNLPGAGFAAPCASLGLTGFLAKVNPDGDQLAFGGCLGGASSSTVTALTLDRQGNIYAAGSASRNFPVTPGAFNAAFFPGYTNFVQKIAGDSSRLIYSAVFPGGSFGVSGIAADANQTVYLVGEVEGDRLPIAGPAMQPCPGPGSQVRYSLVHLKADGSTALYSSFDPGSRLALAPDGSLSVGGTALRKLTALDAPGDSFLSQSCVLNGASLASHLDYGQPGISPGEIVTLRGTGLGPIPSVGPAAVDALLATSLGGTQVLFDGIPAPLLYAHDAQINVLAPYRLATRTTTSIQVCYLGQSTHPVTMPVSPVSAALFRTSTGSSVLNSDYSLNSTANPAGRGSILVFYTTGAGQTDPPSADGQIWQTTGGLQQPVSAQLTNYGAAGEVTAAAPVLYAGPVPSLVSGVQQFNILIPGDLPDSFQTQQFSAGTVLNVQIGPQQLTVPVFVR
jgi:uncharacterized protein (TIGR03437 family)